MKTAQGMGLVGRTYSLVDLSTRFGAVALELLLSVRRVAWESRLDAGRSLVQVAYARGETSPVVSFSKLDSRFRGKPLGHDCLGHATGAALGEEDDLLSNLFSAAFAFPPALYR